MARSNKQQNQLKKEEQAHNEAVSTAVGKTEEFFQKNDKTITWILIAVIVIVGGYFAYKYLVAQPRTQKAASEMFVAEQLFGSEQWDAALNGDGNNAGFLEIVDNYGSTPQGSLAAHYAGISYLKMGDNAAALKFLAKYRTAKGATAEIVNAQNYGLQADIYSAEGDNAKAIKFYHKAIKASNNVLTAPYYLKKLGIVYEAEGNKAEALKAYERIANEFFTSLEARDIQTYIGRLK